MYLLNIKTVSSQIIINEVCASNSELISDKDSEYPDWIELLNIGNEPLNLSGFCLRDDSSSATQWCFPEYIINPGEYMVIFASGKDFSTAPSNWKTIVNQGDIWRYTIPSSNIPGWRDRGFDDSGWSEGPSGFGYGDGDDVTIIPSNPAPSSFYMRIGFEIQDASQIDEAMLNIDYDDGFAAFINGKEIAMSNVAGSPPDFSTLANPDHEAVMYSGGNPESFNISLPKTVFQDGENVLAIEVHNVSTTSSDMTSIPFLSVLSKTESGSPPPSILNLPNHLFHTNFKLNADGDSLFLSNPEGLIIDSLIYSQHQTDHSFGRIPGQYSSWSVFTDPTPGNSNTTQSFIGYVEDQPQFSVKGGRFSDPFQLSISSPVQEDLIYYSLDGSIPKTDGFQYTSPFGISHSITVRAQIVRPGYIDGQIISKTYLQADHSGLTVISLSTDPYNLWDNDYGMYADGPNASNDFPHFGANFWNDWERPVHLEIYDENDTLIINTGAGIKIFGGWSRGFPQKSLSIFARNKYGDRKFLYPFFDDKPIEDFEALVFRNSGNDWFSGSNQSGILFRDAFMTGLLKDMDLERQAFRQAVVYLNGEYWGIHNIREKVNEHFIASNAGIDPDKIELLEGNQVSIIGSNLHYASLINFIGSNSMANNAHYDYVKTQMDIQNFINYELAQIYFDNRDWPGNNIKYWRPAMENGKWRWIIYDTDFGFGMWDRNKVYDNTLEFALDADGPGWPNPPWSTFLLRKLVGNLEFRNQFINSFADHMNTTFHLDSVYNQVNELRGNIENEIYNHIDRWGGVQQNWYNRTEDLKFFGRIRTSYVQNHIINRFDLGGKHTVTVSVSENGSGSVRLNTLLLNEFPWTGTYFEDVPIQLTAIPSPGYIFTGWSGASSSKNPKTSINLTVTASLTANFEPDPNPDPNRIIINEICYNSDSLNSSGDWIELCNISDQYVDLSGWIIRDGNNMHTYEIKRGSIMNPDGYFVVCRDKYKFATIHSEVDPYDGNLDFGLSSLGDIVRLYNSNGELVDYLSYMVNSPWPTIEPGSGYTLSLLSPELDNFLAESWSISNEQYGTPGRKNFEPNSNVDPEILQAADILFQNGPNPFSRTTRVLFYTSEYQQIKLSVYDLNGRLVDLLWDEMTEKGYHEVNWTSTVSSGIYILRMDSRDSVQTIRMLKTE